MNYQHAYHAGSAADVFKHIVLLAMLEQFKQKPKPFFALDTHAGAGVYDLTHSGTTEWQTGIGRLSSTPFTHPLLQRYQTFVKDLTHFPGSPLLMQQLLREGDELILIEQADLPHRQLHRLFHHHPQVHIHQTDAWITAKSLLPPTIRRGLVLIDPPYEQADEFERGIQWLHTAIERWATATYLLWYPIKSRARIEQFHRQLKQKLQCKLLIVECCPWSDDVPVRLNGSGLIIINEPWQFEKTLTPVMDELMPCLKQHEKGKWLMHR